jgi:KaiC/GvpD/RAD55 family RecA-like ATPase
MADRCPTGITGLDNIIDGGLPRNRSILLSGTCGTGKTVFGIQFLANGINKYNEPGVFLTLEQSAEEVRKDMLGFGIDIKKLEDQGKLVLIDTSLSRIGLKNYISNVPTIPKGSFSLLPDEFDMSKVLELTLQAVENIHAKRLVIDSLPALDYLIKETHDVRKVLINMNYALKKANLTTLIITESLEEDGISRHQVEEYISDGVIILRTNEALDTRTIKIRKMRLTQHSLKPLTFELTNQGINVKENKKGIM